MGLVFRFLPSALQHLTPTNTKNRTVRTKGIYLTKSHNRTCPIIALDLTDSKTCQQCANTLKEITRSCALGHPNYLSWLCSICVVMPYFRFFNNCLANWVRQGTRRLKLALKSLKCLFYCSYFCSSYFFIIIILIITPRIFYTFYVALENSKTFSQ